MEPFINEQQNVLKNANLAWIRANKDSIRKELGIISKTVTYTDATERVYIITSLPTGTSIVLDILNVHPLSTSLHSMLFGPGFVSAMRKCAGANLKIFFFWLSHSSQYSVGDTYSGSLPDFDGPWRLAPYVASNTPSTYQLLSFDNSSYVSGSSYNLAGMQYYLQLFVTAYNDTGAPVSTTCAVKDVQALLEYYPQ